MAARWTQSGWTTILGIASNAVSKTGDPQSGYKVIDDSERVWNLLTTTRGVWKDVKNIYGDDRHWHPFHNGKVLVWKTDEVVPIFVGAFYSLPNPLYV